ncbi:TetR/AcrR family transcriptional regulator [Paractinoplanes lichenicola]|uniref:TetR/AcrR family transcriptional regulator n=1 Tax=Paractinoplanes lichenicola TaxID=2802976 RepID=A0ABS1VLX6_9ACTN|nr:TetR/AcrR family transcriptional regulator [Actinoplanes lichenicola]MBL7255731.1 TetR/AcrR family transcriptional regulator [Actinoplanes lichenicola]
MVVNADRRAALKARHRRAILDAAKALIDEGGAARFSVDQLAERADVSRRTIFNHFASIDDVVTTACTEVLGVVIDTFRRQVSESAAGAGSRAEMFEVVSAALRATDVPGIIAFLWQALGGFSADDPRPQQIFQATFSRTTEELARELAERHADRDPLEAELLVSSLMHGTEVIAHHWIADTGATTDERSRAHWHHLLDRLIDHIRTGY